MANHFKCRRRFSGFHWLVGLNRRSLDVSGTLPRWDPIAITPGKKRSTPALNETFSNGPSPSCINSQSAARNQITAPLSPLYCAASLLLAASTSLPEKADNSYKTVPSVAPLKLSDAKVCRTLSRFIPAVFLRTSSNRRHEHTKRICFSWSRSLDLGFPTNDFELIARKLFFLCRTVVSP